MAIKPHHRKPVRSLLLMFIVVLGLAGMLGVGHVWGEGASWAPQNKAAPLVPKKGMDLEGGTEVILKPQVGAGESVSEEKLNRAIDIIRARVDGQGVSEANVSKLGENVQVSIPGTLTPEQEDALKRSSQMRFRPVLAGVPVQPEAPPAAPAPAPAKTTGKAPATSAPAVKPSGSVSAPGSASPSTSQRAVLQPGLVATPPAQTTAPAPSKSAPPAGLPAVPGAPGAPGAPPAMPAAAKTPPAPLPPDKQKDPKAVAAYTTDQGWVTPEYQKQLMEYQCTTTKDGKQVQKPYDPQKEDLSKPTVACMFETPAGKESSPDLAVPVYKYLLGPAIFDGSGLSTASAGPSVNSQGQPTGGYEVRLSMKSEYAAIYAEVSRVMTAWKNEPRGQLATVLDNRIITAPYFESVIPTGEARISGKWDAEGAQALADQLKFGALPVNFQMQSRNTISPTLGEDQMMKGLIAGFIGLFLVVVYSLFQYRLLGLVTVASLIIVALLTWLSICFFGWVYNLRLTMAGITGAIVAIGTTADSFIIYFERVRDEVREGRQLRSAVEAGWKRATHTILISDAVNFLAALVLYLLASHNVKGFAFMLMLTTVLDVIVVFWFTHPMLTLLASTKLFREGHPWSGLDPRSLRGDRPRYRGAGRIGTSPLSPKESHV